MAKKAKYKTGNVFSVKVAENEYIFGRVIFDVSTQYIETSFYKKEKTNNYLDFFNKCFLIETFYGVFSDIKDVDMEKKAVISTFVSDDFYKASFFKERDFKTVGFKSVDYKNVSFPETLFSYNMNFYYSVGELFLPININRQQCDEIKVYPSFGNGYWTVIVATLDFSGRDDLIEAEDNEKQNHFRWSDLRSLPEIRNRLYELIGEDPNQNYYKMALKHGFDLARLY
jgi:hypothetical protein